jgi:hypothetical protein
MAGCWICVRCRRLGQSTNRSEHDPPAPSQATLSPVAASLSGATSFACERLVQVARENSRSSLFNMFRTMNPHLGETAEAWPHDDVLQNPIRRLTPYPNVDVDHCHEQRL